MMISFQRRSLLTALALMAWSMLGHIAILVTAGTNEKGIAFLESNKGKDGVISLPSGLQYKVLRKGRGADHPVVNSPCSCHYEGKLLDGTVFDSSYDRGDPATFAPNQVIKGWTEAMQMMVVGDKWEMYIPSELGYGDRGSPPKIGGGDVLIFTMEILAIQGGTVKALQCSIDSDDKNDGCNEKEHAYTAKIRTWYAEGNDTKASAQLARVRKILSAPMKDDLRDWARRRVNILEQFVTKQGEQGQETKTATEESEL